MDRMIVVIACPLPKILIKELRMLRVLDIPR